MNKIRLSAFADEISSNLDDQIKVLKENNIHFLELRSIDGINISQFSNEYAKEYKRKLDEAGIKVYSLGSPLGKVDISVTEEDILNQTTRLCELAQIFDCKNIRMFSFFKAYENKEKVYDFLNKMVKIAQKYSINLCHENEKDIYGDSVDRVLDIFKNVPGLKQVYDPANFIQCDQDSAYSLTKLHHFVYYFHIKDAMKDGGYVVSAGRGDGNIEKLIEMIKDDKVLTLEPHLKVFSSYCKVDSHELKNKEYYETNIDAFNAATKALKEILIKKGYKEIGDSFIKE